MLHTTTQSAMSLSFEGYFKIQLLLKTTIRQSQDTQQLRLWMASTHEGMDFFLSSFPAKQENGLCEAEKQKKSLQPNYPEPILVY